ncbi:hypothetical protein [Streptococcus suis]|uniref:Uncharacterized protein n=1 Tax=Streptococcus suis TaxID=1307 RepID=A0A9X4N0N3_STRSU|nr:hypothetical protein [Streptococcus suis]MBY4974414.1 hypothetical protein [Streptococcus suis]MBY5026111.1 hypothetical protein [Streptococcus suis]MCK3895334.1 hypothetical protein [Streptococcus suis]MDG4526808.1 hypothetical protein [Streptococcus suis]MDG4529311.1 hypothetical protein [Streptococcus suis]
MIWLIKLLLVVVISIPVTSILQPFQNHYLNGVTVGVISVIVSHLVDKYGKGGDEV